MNTYRHLDSVPGELVSSRAALHDLVHRMSQCKRIALDTEFMQGEVYKPVLALIQVALEDQSVHLIDPVALSDLRTLGDILSDKDIVKVLHSPAQDLGLLHETTNAAFKNVFDTRLAGQLLSLGKRASLSEYVSWLTGEALDKGPQRSDWLQRPLARSQIQYACNDVIHLLPMHERMLQRAQDIGRHAWIEEDMRRYDDSVSYDAGVDPVKRAFKVAGVRALGPRHRSVLAEIALWREEMAQQLDIPARHLLTRNQMLHIARKVPKTPAAARAVIPEAMPFARYIADRVRAGLERSDSWQEYLPPPRPRLTRVQKQCYRLLRTHVRSIAEELDIPAMHLARKPDLEQLARQAEDRDAPFLHGWRRDVIGRDLLQITRDFFESPTSGP